MALTDLRSLVTPPYQPSHVGTLEEWQSIERELGLEFPIDYREFVFAYGRGQFAREYFVYVPFVAHLGYRYIEWVRYLCECEMCSRDATREYLPYRPTYPIWPEPDGLLPWGGDNNGNTYFWLTTGPPDDWPVVSSEPRGNGYRQEGGTMTEYLAGVLRGRVVPLIGDYPSPEVFVFEALP